MNRKELRKLSKEATIIGEMALDPMEFRIVSAHDEAIKVHNNTMNSSAGEIMRLCNNNPALQSILRSFLEAGIASAQRAGVINIIIGKYAKALGCEIKDVELNLNTGKIRRRMEPEKTEPLKADSPKPEPVLKEVPDAANAV